MKSLEDVLECLLIDIERLTGADLRRDSQTIRRRVADEGDSFITITLPSFCQAFERGLEEGRLDPSRFPAFKKRSRRGALPAFLQGLLLQVFDQQGILLETPRVDCIRAVRQLCLFCKKVQRPCSSERELAAIRGYQRCEAEVREPAGDQFTRFYLATCRVVLDSVLGPDFGSFPMIPNHGPGATQERVTGNRKWRSLATTWTQRLESAGLGKHGLVYPEYPIQSIHSVDSDLNRFRAERDWQEASALWLRPDARLLSPEQEPPVRVVFVPKTQKTPRVIAVEPVCMQFVQQGIARFLMRRIEHAPLTAGHVNFTNQSINQVLARDSSLRGHLATLDLSEASDRVSLAHAEGLFKSSPILWEKILACRSTRAQLPNGEVLPLRKFASMGSALCFPVEAMVFYCAIVAFRLQRAGLFPDEDSVRKYGRDVYVYGDDLIVPVDEAPAICDALEAFGLKVNRHKSFWSGKFRESCGEDCYDGQRVTPVYLRRDVPTDRRDVSGVLSSIATANQLFAEGYVATATCLKEAVESLLGPLPQIQQSHWDLLYSEVTRYGKPLAGTSAIGWTFHSNERPRRRWDKKLQRHLVYCLAPYTTSDDDPLDGYDALAKCFRTVRGVPPLASQFRDPDTEHLERSVRRYGLGLRRTWVPDTFVR